MCEARPKTLSDIFVRLRRHRAADGDDCGVGGIFPNLERNSERVHLAHAILKRYDLWPPISDVGAKNRKMADQFREAGNRHFKLKRDALALENYTQSVAYAPRGSKELALAFANRSAVLYELKLYEECLRDITQAFSSNYPQHLQHKLLKRRQNAEAARSSQREVKYHESVPTLSSTPNPDIECAGSSIRICFEKSLGRHVVAVKDIKVGEIIAIEEPFAKVLLRENYPTHCYNCLRPSPNLIPCDNCVLALYCDEGCKRSASDTFHKYECPILATLLDLDVGKLGLLALKICILAEFKQGDDESTLYKSGNYREIHNLIANTHLRPFSDLFRKATAAAVIYELLEKNTRFFNDGGPEKREIFQDLLLLHMQTGPSNFHEISQVNNGEDANSGEIGAGAYAFLSLLNHSCNPNVVRHCHGSSIVLRALRPIAKGEQLFDNYGYHYAIMQREDRRKHLTDQYFFHCQCEACENNWPLYPKLPVRNIQIWIVQEQIKALRDGSVRMARSLMDYLERTAQSLDGQRPCRELADVQEILKQCYTIFGNRRITF